MARNKFTDINALDNPVADQITQEIMKDADLQSTTDNKHKRGGRKAKEVKADKLIRVYVTEPQKTLLEEYCSSRSMSESALVKQLLAKEGVF